MYLKHVLCLAGGCLLLSMPDTGTALGQSFTEIVLSDDMAWSEGGNWIDYDNDDDLDLFIPNNRRAPNRNTLYRNDGDDTFTRITAGDLVEDVVMSESGTWGDYDNDGDLDLFVADGGFDAPRFNSLYRNEGGGAFTEITQTVVDDDLSFATSSSWADADNDGDLDLLAATLSPANNPNVGGLDLFYTNNGDGTFTKITTGPIVTTPTRSFGVAWSDVDLDGDVDLFVANNAGNSVFYRNEGAGTFARPTVAQVGSLVGEGGSIAPSWGDYNNDGYPDLFVSNFQRNDYLYRNNGNGTFTKITTGPVVTSGGIGEGSAWGDYDNDGDLDLFVANGGAQTDVNFLFQNQLTETGTATFTRITTGRLVTRQGCYAGAAWGDYDNDGDLDLFVANFNGKTSLIYRNETTDNHWLNVRLRGATSNRSAIGARVGIKATVEEQSTWQWREVAGQTGYNAQNSLRVHFGLADAVIIDSLRIVWPSGLVEVYAGIPADQFLVATEGQTVSPVATEEVSDVPSAFTLAQNYPNPFHRTTTIPFTLEQAEPVSLIVYDLQGRAVKTLVQSLQPAGQRTAVWDGTNEGGRRMPSGLYLYRLESGTQHHSQAMLLLK